MATTAPIFQNFSVAIELYGSEFHLPIGKKSVDDLHQRDIFLAHPWDNLIPGGKPPGRIDDASQNASEANVNLRSIHGTPS